MKTKHIRGRQRRSYKIKAKIRKYSDRIRLVVFRSNKYMAAQLIDDKNRKTLLSVHEKALKIEKNNKSTKTQRAKLVGIQTAHLAQKLKIKNIVFDRNGYRYHGRIKALAEAARDGGLKF